MISISDLCTRLALAGHPLSGDQLLALEGAVVRPQSPGVFPVASSVEKVRDYLEWLVQMGKGAYRLELRERYVAIPPMVEANAFDDENRVAFLIGVH